MEFIERLFNEYMGSFFLFGPRGTGKSTWLKTRYPHSLIIEKVRLSRFFHSQ